LQNQIRGHLIVSLLKPSAYALYKAAAISYHIGIIPEGEKL